MIEGVTDDQLAAPTPCRDTSVGALLDHVNSFSLAFTAAATKTQRPSSSAPAADASRLGDDWRRRIPDQLAQLAAAWRHEDAWVGMTRAGGVDLPGDVAGVVALNEIVIHSWDLARATAQPLEVEPVLVEAIYPFVEGVAVQNPQGQPGLFGPPDDAPRWDRLLGLAGRDPGWTAP